MMGVAEKCRCGYPLFPKAYPDGSGREYTACHHCDRGCGGWTGDVWNPTPVGTCPRCKQSAEWEPYPGYRAGAKDW